MASADHGPLEAASARSESNGAALDPLVWFALSYLSARSTGLVVLFIALPLLFYRLRHADKTTRAAVMRAPIIVTLLSTSSAISNDPRFVLLMPVLISVALLGTFGHSLWSVPMIERFARLASPELTEAQQAHCKRWTIRWCVFFLVNGALASWSIVWSHRAWAIYNGAVSYALMGTMFVLERIERGFRFPSETSSLDRALARVRRR